MKRFTVDQNEQGSGPEQSASPDSPPTRTTFKFTGINHLALVTGDMEATIHFWRDLLGMRLVAGLGQPGYRHYFFEISENDLLAFFEWPDVEVVPEKDHGYPVKGPVIFDHVSFGLPSLDDLHDLKARLIQAGFPVSGVIDHGFILSIYTWDPNGVPIEFSVPVKEADIRRTPKMADLSPTPSAQEGPEPRSDRWSAPSQPLSENERRIYRGAGSELFHGTSK